MAAETPQQRTPTWLREGIDQYFQLGGAQNVRRDADAPYGHLSTFIQHHGVSSPDGESVSPPHDEVTSDALYVPEELRVEDSPMGEDDTFVVKSMFTLDTYYTNPQFRLGINPIRGESRKATLKAMEAGQETSVHRADVGGPIVSVTGNIRGTTRGAIPKAVRPTVRELQNGEIVSLARPSQAAKAVLRLFLIPDLAPEIQRATLTTHMDPRYLADMIRG